MYIRESTLHDGQHVISVRHQTSQLFIRMHAAVVISIIRLAWDLGDSLPWLQAAVDWQVARAGRFGTKGLAITFVSDEADARVLNDVQERFEVNITELPEEIDLTSYSKYFIDWSWWFDFRPSIRTNKLKHFPAVGHKSTPKTFSHNFLITWPILIEIYAVSWINFFMPQCSGRPVPTWLSDILWVSALGYFTSRLVSSRMGDYRRVLNQLCVCNQRYLRQRNLAISPWVDTARGSKQAHHTKMCLLCGLNSTCCCLG